MIDAKITWTDDANASSALLSMATWISEMGRSPGADRVSVSAVVQINSDDAPLQRLYDQIMRINRWCAEHAPDEYHSDGDTADAMIAAADRLRGQVARLQAMLAAADAAAYAAAEASTTLRHDLATAIAERDVAFGKLDKLNGWITVSPHPTPEDSNSADDSIDAVINVVERQGGEIGRLLHELAILRSYAIATPHGNGKSSVAAAAAAIQAADLPEQYPPAIAAAMNAVAVPVEQAADVIAQEAAAEAAQAAAKAKSVQIADDPELHDYIIGLDAGRHTWRTIPKPVRWRLVQAHLRSIWTDGKLPSMDDFDKHAPAWMPTSNACAMTFGDGKWTVVCGKAVES